MRYAGFWVRAFSLFFDGVILLPLTIVRNFALGRPVFVAVPLHLAVDLLMIVYPVYFHAKWGKTIGKMLVKIKVTKLDGTPIGWHQAILRSSVDIALWIIFITGAVYMLFTRSKPTWSSLGYFEHGELFFQRNPFGRIYDMASSVWIWSEVVVLLFNEKKRAIHDFIAGTVVIKTRAPAL